MELIYPQKGARIMVPVQLDGSHGLVVFELAHRDPTATVQWHLDGEHIGTTTKEHRLAADLQHGPHRLTLTDRLGTTISTTFTVDRGISRKR
jgi:penicillin-binding protein 1C